MAGFRENLPNARIVSAVRGVQMDAGQQTNQATVLTKSMVGLDQTAVSTKPPAPAADLGTAPMQTAPNQIQLTPEERMLEAQRRSYTNV